MENRRESFPSMVSCESEVTSDGGKTTPTGHKSMLGSIVWCGDVDRTHNTEEDTFEENREGALESSLGSDDEDRVMSMATLATVSVPMPLRNRRSHARRIDTDR